MENVIKGTTKGGKEWIPNFISSIDKEQCICCGRCFKVCGHSVLNLPVPDEDEESKDLKMTIEIVNADNCIGCESCGMVCPKKCYTYSPVKY